MLSFVACGDDDGMGDDPPQGPCASAPDNTEKVIAQFEDETSFWSCASIFVTQSGTNLAVNAICGSGASARTVQFQLDNFNGTGTYPLTSGEMNVVPGIGDLPTDVHSSTSGNLVITKSESAPNKLSGTFEGTVSASNQGVTVTMELTCGSFEDITWL